jgi:hypothetical protein
MENLSEMAVLRTMLRDVNVRYSTLARTPGEVSKTQLDVLRTHRLVLMARIAGLGTSVRDRLPKK